MTTRPINLSAGAFIFVLGFPAMPQDSQVWVDVKDPNRLRALHSNKTPRGVAGRWSIPGCVLPLGWQRTRNPDRRSLRANLGSQGERGVLPGHSMVRLSRVPTQQGKPQRVSNDLGWPLRRVQSEGWSSGLSAHPVSAGGCEQIGSARTVYQMRELAGFRARCKQ